MRSTTSSSPAGASWTRRAPQQPEYIKQESSFDAYSGIYWFNPDAFLPNFTNNDIGNIPRRVPWLRGPGITQLDASLFRNFRYRERFTFEVRAEAMNVTNSTHFGDPNTLARRPCPEP